VAPRTGHEGQGRVGSKAAHRYYRCRNNGCDGGGDGRVNIGKAEMEARFTEHLSTLSAPEGLVNLFAEVLKDTFRDRHKDQERPAGASSGNGKNCRTSEPSSQRPLSAGR